MDESFKVSVFADRKVKLPLSELIVPKFVPFDIMAANETGLKSSPITIPLIVI